MTQFPQASAPTLNPPIPGQYWPEQKGYYAGIARSADACTGWHLIVLAEPEFTPPSMPWGPLDQEIAGADDEYDGLANTIAMAKGGSELAAFIQALPAPDCYLPSRFESALIYATLRDRMNFKSWFWTSTQHDASYAWHCYFLNGLQILNLKRTELAAVAVRRLALQSFNPLTAES